MSQTKWRRGFGAFLVLTLVTLLIGLLWPKPSANADQRTTATSTNTVAPTSSSVPTNTPPIDWTDSSKWPDLPVAQLEDPGPGRCFPDVLAKRRQMAEAGQFKQYEQANGGIDFQPPYSDYEKQVLQADIVTVIKDGKVESTRPNCLADLANWLKSNADYTQVDVVVGHSFDPSNRDDLVNYFGKLKMVELSGQLAVQNHYFTVDQGVQPYRLEKLPEHELVFFVPGYEPGNPSGNSVRPVAKLVCGNPLLPPPPPATPAETPPGETPAPPATGGPPPAGPTPPGPTPPGPPTTRPFVPTTAPPTTVPPTTCVTGKCVPPTTVAPPPTTTPPPTNPPSTACQYPSCVPPGDPTPSVPVTHLPTTTSPAPPPTTAAPPSTRQCTPDYHPPGCIES